MLTILCSTLRCRVVRSSREVADKFGSTWRCSTSARARRRAHPKKNTQDLCRWIRGATSVAKGCGCEIYMRSDRGGRYESFWFNVSIRVLRRRHCRRGCSNGCGLQRSCGRRFAGNGGASSNRCRRFKLIGRASVEYGRSWNRSRRPSRLHGKRWAHLRQSGGNPQWSPVCLCRPGDFCGS